MPLHVSSTMCSSSTSTTTTPWLYSPCRTLASITTIFQSSLLCARNLQFVTPILLRPSLTSSIHLNLGLPPLLLPSGVFWYNLFVTLSSLILSTCPSHLNLPFFYFCVFIIRRSKLYYTASGIITPVGGRPLHRLREVFYRCDDTRFCIIQFWPRDDEHIVLKTCKGI